MQQRVKLHLNQGETDRIINKMRFADDMAIVAKIQEEVQNVVNRLFETGRTYAMEINIDKVMRVSRSR